MRPRRSARSSPGQSAGACSTPTRPRRGSRTRSDRGSSNDRSTHGQTSDSSPTRSGRATGRSCCSPPRLGCGRANGLRSSTATSTSSPASSTSSERFETDASNARRPTRARVPCRSRRSRSLRSRSFLPDPIRRSCSPPCGAATSTCTPSAIAIGSPPSAPRHVHRGRPIDVHQRGRCGRQVDAERTPRQRSLSSKHALSRAKPRALCRTRTDDPFLTMEVLYQLS
jgi:hypothetical protein